MGSQGRRPTGSRANRHTGRVRECHCQLCGRLPATDPLAASVARRGWSVVSVPEDGRRPAYAFTVGLWHSFGSAEASVFGRDDSEMVRWLDTVGGEVEAGRVLHPVGGGHPHTPGDRQGDDVLGSVDVFPRPALASWHRHLFGAALAFYRGQPVPMLQLVWPDDARSPAVGAGLRRCLPLRPAVAVGPGHRRSRPGRLALPRLARRPRADHQGHRLQWRRRRRRGS